jgi:hypothetical protein
MAIAQMTLFQDFVHYIERRKTPGTKKKRPGSSGVSIRSRPDENQAKNRCQQEGSTYSAGNDDQTAAIPTGFHWAVRSARFARNFSISSLSWGITHRSLGSFS